MIWFILFLFTITLLSIYFFGAFITIFAGVVAKVWDYDSIEWIDLFFAAVFWPRIFWIKTRGY